MLKKTGIKRRIDELGRIVLPIEIRNKLEIEVKDSMEIYVDNDKIVLRKYEPSCIFCGNSKETTKYNEKLVCQKCIKQIKEKCGEIKED